MGNLEEVSFDWTVEAPERISLSGMGAAVRTIT